MKVDKVIQKYKDDLEGFKFFLNNVPTANRQRNFLVFAEKLYVAQKYQFALETYKVAVSIGKKLRNKLLEANGEKGCGLCYLKLNELEKARNSNNQASFLFFEIKNSIGEADCRLHDGAIKRQLGLKEKNGEKAHRLFKLAIIQISSAKKIYEWLELREKAVKCYINIANLYDAMGNYTWAINYLESAIQVTNNQIIQAKICNNLGNFYSKVRNYNVALNYYEYAFNQFTENKDTENKRIVSINTG